MKKEAWRGYADAEVLARVSVRLIEPGEKAAWDQLISERHYLRNAHLVGRQLRYVAELDGRWVALLGYNVAAYHLKGREEWIGWSIAQRPVDEKSNEITALRPMLQDVPLDGVVVTADAMQAQQDAARFLTQEKGADYFFSMKGNQPSVEGAAERFLNRAFPPWGAGASEE